jgi:NAD(P)-dependent dehydrogenase (short-subunit alcohol dehydrogenase family)
VITGREIGAAWHFASEGAAGVPLDLTESQGPAVADDGILQESDEALFIPADVSSQAGVAEIIKTTRQSFGRLDVVVNMAGFNRKGRVDSPSIEDSVMEGNIRDMLLTIKHAVPLMKETGEVIINLSSVPVYVEADWYAAYHANKGAMLSTTRALALELAPRNIRANAVSLLNGHPLFG